MNDSEERWGCGRTTPGRARTGEGLLKTLKRSEHMVRSDGSKDKDGNGQSFR